MERERDDHREAKQKTRVVVVVVVVVVTLSLFSPSKSFGAVERGGGRRQKARDDVFLLDRIDRVSSLFPKSSSKKSYTNKKVVVVVVVPSFLSSRRCGV